MFFCSLILFFGHFRQFCFKIFQNPLKTLQVLSQNGQAACQKIVPAKEGVTEMPRAAIFWVALWPSGPFEALRAQNAPLKIAALGISGSPSCALAIFRKPASPFRASQAPILVFGVPRPPFWGKRWFSGFPGPHFGKPDCSWEPKY